MTFTQHPHIGKLPPYYVKDLRRYAHTAQNTHAVQPYAYFLFLYQQPVIFGGLLFLFAVLAGLVGVLRSWRRWGGLQALPWVVAAVSLVLPAMLTQSLYRYTIVAIPLACLAAGMAFARLDGARWPAPARRRPAARPVLVPESPALEPAPRQESPAQQLPCAAVPCRTGSRPDNAHRGDRPPVTARAAARTPPATATPARATKVTVTACADTGGTAATGSPAGGRPGSGTACRTWPPR